MSQWGASTSAGATAVLAGGRERYDLSESKIELRIAGAEDMFRVMRFTGTEGLSILYRFELDLAADRAGVAIERLVGCRATLHVQAPSGERWFHGLISRLQHAGDSPGSLSYRAELVPLLWLLGQQYRCRIFQNKSVPQIVTDVLEGAGLLHGATSLELCLVNRYAARVYCVQYRETDLHFIARLLEDEGIYYFFEHRAEDCRLVLADSPIFRANGTGQLELPYCPPAGLLPTDDHISSFQVSHEVRPAVAVLRDYNHTRPPLNLECQASTGSPGAAEVYDYPGKYELQAEGHQRVQMRAEELACRQHAGFGRSNCAALVPGVVFRLKEHPQKGCNGEYCVTRVTHRGRQALGDTFNAAGALGAGVAPQLAQALYAASHHEDPAVRDLAQAVGQLAHRLRRAPPDTLRTLELWLRHGGQVPTDPATVCAARGGDPLNWLHELVRRLDGATDDPTEAPVYECDFECIPSEVPFRPPRITPRPLMRGCQTAVVVGPPGEEICVDEYGRVKVKFHWDRAPEDDDRASCWIRLSQGWAGGQYGMMFLPRVGQEVLVDFLEGDPDQPIITGRVYNGDLRPPYKLPDEKTKSTLKSNATKDSQRFHEIRFEDLNQQEQLFIRAQRRMDTRVVGPHYNTTGGSLHEQVGYEDDTGQKKGRYYRTVSEGVDLHNEGDQYELVAKDRHEIVQGNALDVIQKAYALMVSQGAEINAQKVVIEAAQGIALKVGGNFVNIDPAGVTIQGTLAKVNCGGAAPSVTPKAAQKALGALPADTGKPGADKAPRKEPSGRQTMIVAPLRAPAPPAARARPPKPPTPAATAPPTPAPVPQSKVPCGIAQLEVTCEHKPEGVTRKPGPNRVLQIVCDAVLSAQYSRSWMSPASERTFEVSGLLRAGGDDQLALQVSSVDKLEAGRKQTLVTPNETAPKVGEWVDGPKRVHKVQAPRNSQLFPIKTRPEVFYVYGRGCDDVTQRVRIESFPSQQYEFSVGLDLWDDWTEKVNRWLEKLTARFNAQGALNLKLEVTGPHGSLTGKWGWQEETDWRAYFNLEFEIGLKRVVGFSIELKVSLMTIALGVVGIPPPLGKLFADHVADAFFFIMGAAEVFFVGRPSARFYTTGEQRLVGKAALGIEGGPTIGMGARAGSDYLVAVEVRGSVTVRFTATGECELTREGLFLSPKVELNPAVIRATAVLKAFTKTIREDAVEWEVLETMQLYPDPDRPAPRYKLLPRDGDGQ